MITRRRFISITAAFGGVALGGGTVSGETVAKATRWQGVALGADAEIIIHHPDPDLTSRLITAGVEEVARLERVFSLYRSDSELVELNAAGILRRPSHDMLRLLTLSQHMGRLTDGAFDISVQPLWHLYAKHFGQPDADPTGPRADPISAVLKLIDYRAIGFDTRSVWFDKPGMALTFNGIAQGYITDRVAEIMHRGGLNHVLTNMGEISAVGGAAGRPWRVKSRATGGVLDITNGAMATSEGAGTRFDMSGLHHHLLAPNSGRSVHQYDAVTVLAKDAATADALSTAFYVMPPQRARRVLAALPGTQAYFRKGNVLT